MNSSIIFEAIRVNDNRTDGYLEILELAFLVELEEELEDDNQWFGWSSNQLQNAKNQNGHKYRNSHQFNDYNIIRISCKVSTKLESWSR